MAEEQARVLEVQLAGAAMRATMKVPEPREEAR